MNISKEGRVLYSFIQKLLEDEDLLGIATVIPYTVHFEHNAVFF